MSNKKTAKRRLAALNKGRSKTIGFFESIPLKISGRKDGCIGLPREMDKNSWSSPRMDAEVNSYREFCAKAWGRLQVELEPSYARMGELLISLPNTQTNLAHARKMLADATKSAGQEDATRMKGEDRLTGAQVKARRTAERAKRIAPLRSRVASLESESAATLSEFFALHSKIVEDANSTHMICNRLHDHIKGRLDVYWSAALRKHPDFSKMPMYPAVELISTAEEAYTTVHRDIMDRAQALINTCTADAKEVA